MRRIVPLVSCVFLTLTVAGCTSGSDTGSSEAPSRIIALTRAGNVVVVNRVSRTQEAVLTSFPCDLHA